MAQRRTDLAREAHEIWQEGAGKAAALQGVRAEEGELEGLPLHRVWVMNEEGAKAIGKPVGEYITLETDGFLRREEDGFGRAVRAIAGLLAPMIPREGTVLVAGLGNRAVTPDLIGPLAAEHTLVTRHLVAHLSEHFGGFRPVAVVAPGVLATTGVESGQLVAAAARELAPSCVIAVDALASRSVERLCRTVQITDTGIVPGSGVGNHRMALNRKELGVPVVAVGVPTVVEAATLMMDLLGRETDEGLPGGDLFVTPREVDSRVADLSRAIGWGISLALNPALSMEELAMLLE